MRARVWVVAGGAIALAVVIALVLQPEPAALVTELEVPERQPSSANERPDERGASVVIPATAPSEPKPEANLPTAPVVTPLMEIFARAGREPPARLVTVEREFLVESVDAAWASVTEAGILAKIAEESGLKLLNLQVECRTTQCRLLLTVPQGAPDEPPTAGDTPLPEFLAGFGMSPHSMIMLPQGSNALNVVAYLLRPGFAPPMSLAPAREPSSVDP